MITGFSIILDDDILFCSNDLKYSVFEIILFIEKLLRSTNPKNTWRLTKIHLKDLEVGRDSIIIKHNVTKKYRNLFFCVVGNFLPGSLETKNLVNEFSKQVNLHYKNLDTLKQASEEPVFKDIIKLIIAYLEDKYIEPLKEEVIFDERGNNNTNTIMYAGISSQGLPIISELYDTDLVLNLAKEKTDENIELFTSELSAKLETIAMNTQIRAKTKIKEIHISDTEDIKNKMLILFGNINGYSLDFIGSGNFFKLNKFFKHFKTKMSSETIFESEFSGNLKPYKHLKQYLSDIIKEFN